MKTLRRRCLHKYYLFLQHVQGGEKKQTHALQAICAMHKILDAVLDSDDLHPLTNKRGLGIWNLWAAPRTARPFSTTVKNQLGTLQHFCKLLLDKRMADTFNPYLVEQITDLMERLPSWWKKSRRFEEAKYITIFAETLWEFCAAR